MQINVNRGRDEVWVQYLLLPCLGKQYRVLFTIQARKEERRKLSFNFLSSLNKGQEKNKIKLNGEKRK
jgi:hypothetical protein